MTAAGDVNILMYHAIANGRGPLAISAATFRRQLDALAAHNIRGVALRDYLTLLDAGQNTDRVAVLTFDDGYRDCAEIVVPELESRGWSCTIFVSTKLIGSSSGWDPDGRGARALIDWTDVRDLARRGIEIGAHGETHADLTRLTFDEAAHEIDGSKREIEEKTGFTVVSFAAPYGRITPELRKYVSRSFRCAVSTDMAAATAASDRFDLPRIDMWYFRSMGRWHGYLNGGRTYFAVRQALRRIRHHIVHRV